MKRTKQFLVSLGFLFILFGSLAINWFMPPLTYLHLEGLAGHHSDTVVVLYHDSEAQVPFLNKVAQSVPKHHILALATTYESELSIQGVQYVNYSDRVTIGRFVLTRAQENVGKRNIYQIALVGDSVLSFRSFEVPRGSFR